jgi:hypothetical protein
VTEKRYASLEDAAYDAAQAIYDATGGNTEATSAIYRLISGEYGFTAPAGSNEKASVSAKLRFPKDSALAALVHNHPEHMSTKGTDLEQALFSGTDVEQAHKLALMSFIAYGSDMRMRSFTPGKDKEQRLSQQGTRIGGQRTSAGTPFDYIPEVKVVDRRIGK